MKFFRASHTNPEMAAFSYLLDTTIFGDRMDVFCNGGDLPVPAPLPLSLYIATRIAKCAVLENSDCPISLEPFSTQKTVWVGTCGHVCGAEFSTTLPRHEYPIKKCPLCRKEETWRCITL
jgi:hypothetical protein